ncbi:S-layer homology domain-containing protein [Bacillus sp. B190/17]|uniref:S-layer homology domain-containing protein n=1 Tax=Bacillus lumedeiriae TaxID=3058829 RepID=A0ABW8IA23_9BACI
MGLRSSFCNKFIAAAATAVIALTAAASGAQAANYKDVHPDGRYKEAVDYLVEHDIAKGYSEELFGTDLSIKRGDAMVMIANALKLDVKAAPPSPFKDLNNRVRQAVNAVYAKGMINGKTSTLFQPEANITRAEMAKVIANAYQLDGKGVQNEFVDVSDRWDEYVDALVKHGITKGKTPDRFGAVQNVTRGEFAIFMYRANAANPNIDWETPAFTYSGEHSFNVEYGAEFAMPDVTAVDRNGKSVKVTSVITNQNGQPFDKIDTKIPGVYTITYKATDVTGNKAVIMDITVTVSEPKRVIDTVNIVDEHTISVKFKEEEAVEIDLEHELVHGQNEVTFTHEGVQYTISVEYDALTPAVKEAEAAIAALPEKVTLQDEEAVTNARALVNKVLAIKEDAEIQGLTTLEEAEAAIKYFKEERITLNQSRYVLKVGKTYKLEATLTPTGGPATSLQWTSSNPDVATVAQDGTVTAVSEGTTTITVTTESGKQASSYITVSNKPLLQFNSYASVTINNEIKGISTSFINMGSQTVKVEKVEVYEGDTRRTVYSEADLLSNEIPVEIKPGERFGIGISYKIGLWATKKNVVKYTINDGEETFEYTSEL